MGIAVPGSQTPIHAPRYAQHADPMLTPSLCALEHRAQFVCTKHQSWALLDSQQASLNAYQLSSSTTMFVVLLVRCFEVAL